jgi:1,4-alpha-glucan branching enzyme
VFLSTSCSDEHAGHNHAKGEHKSSETIVIELDEERSVKHVDWSENATIYEANIRQITPEGTFKAFEKKLNNIKELGIKIIWLMPIQPIGKLNRKGSLGSYYSISDYTATNPEFGSMEDFKSMVNKAHSLDLKILLDWVPNHSSWDNKWAIEHPDYYTKDSKGNFVLPNPDWSDVIEFNYGNKKMQEAMINAMKFWIKSADIDGFRCDMAGMVQLDFWIDVRKELDEIKPVFMLAEAEQDDHHAEAFDMSYAWELMHLLKHVVDGDSSISSIDRYMIREQNKFDKNDYRMQLLTSHDENSWNGTIEERYGDAEKAVAVVIYTINGMPLIYSGQEYGNNKRLAFFEKDNPNYATPEIYGFYQTLIKLNNENKALWNGESGGDYKLINTSAPENIIAFKRQKGETMVLTIVNLSNETIRFNLENIGRTTFTDVFTNDGITIGDTDELVLAPYGYYLVEK